MKKLGRSLLAEIAPLYAAGLAILLLLLLVNFLLTLLADALARGVPIGLVAGFLLARIPSAASAGLTLALLFATLLVLARWTGDRELRAALALGLSPAALLRPLLIVAMGVASIAIVNNEIVVPWAEVRALEIQKQILLEAPSTLLQEGAFFTDARGRSLFLGSLRPGGEATDVVILSPGGLAGPREVIEAEEGRLDDEAGVWRLRELRVRVLDAGRPSLDMRAESGVVPVRELTAAATGRADLVTLPLPELIERLRGDRVAPAAWTALHRKASAPLTAVAFAVFALAVGLAGVRRDTPIGMVSVLLLTFLYYATWSVANLLGAQGTVPAWVAGWAPFAAYLAAGSALLAWEWRR